MRKAQVQSARLPPTTSPSNVWPDNGDAWIVCTGERNARVYLC